MDDKEEVVYVTERDTPPSRHGHHEIISLENLYIHSGDAVFKIIRLPGGPGRVPAPPPGSGVARALAECGKALDGYRDAGLQTPAEKALYDIAMVLRRAAVVAEQRAQPEGVSRG